MASLVALALPSGAAAHFLGYDSVDSGEIRYNDYTTWDSARGWAIDKWNDLGQIDILPDAWNTYADLNFEDYNESDGYCGVYYNSAGADEITLNSNYFPGYGTAQRYACVTHELGHALGLDHSYEDQVMDPCPVCSNPIYHYRPRWHDEADYDDLWG